MKIRFFNTYEPVSPLYRDLFPALLEQGAEIEVVISKAEYRRGRDIVRRFQQTPGIRFIRTINLGKHAYEGAWAKVLVMVLYAVHGALYALLGPGVDKNVFLTQPPFFTTLGVLLSKLRGQPYYCVTMDIQPEMSVALGLESQNALWTRFSKWLSKQAFSHAAGIIVIGRCMRDRVRAMGVEEKRIHVIPNWANEREIYPIPRHQNSLRRDQQWGDKFVVLYAGNIGIPQYFNDLLDVAAALKYRDDILFVFIGDGIRKKWLKQRVLQEQLTNVQLLPFLHEQYSLAEILSSGDVHFVSLQEACTGYAVPSKTYVALASGRPILFQGGSNSEIALMLQETDVGFFVPPGNVKVLQQAIERLADDESLRERLGNNARKAVLTTYSREAAINKYVDVLLRGGLD